MAPSAFPSAAEGLLPFVAGVLLVAGLQALRQWFQAFERRSNLRARFQRAKEGEQQGAQLLRRLGYDVLDAQVPGSYVLVQDGQRVPVRLRADYIVRQDACLYVAEVKTGHDAPKVSLAATRRQLLEYRLCFRVDGLLLVNASNGRVHRVEFPKDDAGALSPKALGDGAGSQGVLWTLVVVAMIVAMVVGVVVGVRAQRM